MNIVIKIFGGVAHVSFFLKVNQLTKERIFHFEATTIDVLQLLKKAKKGPSLIKLRQLTKSFAKALM